MGDMDKVIAGPGFTGTVHPDGDRVFELRAGTRELLRFGRVRCGGFAESGALVKKLRGHGSLDALSASIDMESIVPFGCEYRIGRELEMVSGLGLWTVDVSAVTRGIVSAVELEPVVFPGPWAKMEYLVYGEREFRCVVPGGEEREFAYSLRPVRRGVYGFGKIRVFVSTGHGFVERRYSFAAEREIGVYPSFMMMRRSELLALGNAQQAQDAVRMRRLGGNSSFEQIQPYVAGDDPRTVNWRATARANRLMVNTYREERAQQVYCVLDTGRTMFAPFDGMTMMDHAVNAILSLANVVLKKDFPYNRRWEPEEGAGAKKPSRKAEKSWNW